MRFRMMLSPRLEHHDRAPLLSYNYQYDIAALLYNILRQTESEYSSLHNEQGYKFFTFSRLEIPRRKARKKGLYILSNDCYLWFSSADSTLVKILAEQLIQMKNLHFGGVTFSVLGISTPPVFEPSSEEVVFTTMSPVLVRTTIEDNGGSRTWDLSPDSDDFISRLVDNLRRKYEFYYEKSAPEDMQIMGITNTSQKRIWIKDTSHRAHLLDVSLSADNELLKFAYDCGLGEKNSMGFGMVEVR